MPIVGSVDVSDIIANLGDSHHGLRAGAEVNTEKQVEDIPHRATFGEVDMSLSMVLALPTIHDVNDYYKELGIDKPYRPTKKELRLGYQSVDGPNSHKLTYFFKQLLDPVIRRQYDAMPEGSRFRDQFDIDEDARLLAKAAGEMSEETGRIVTTGELISEQEKIYQERDERKALLESKYSSWDWGYYLLTTRKTEYDDLILWQSYLTIAAAKHNIAPTISIGYIGNTKEPYVVKTWSGKTIVFLNDEVNPTLELAETAVSNLMLPTRKREKNGKVNSHGWNTRG